MIPILYDSTETAFTSNGIGRLRDCISCRVTEERNGKYECEFKYPVTGKRYADIVEGCFISVTHDDTGAELTSEAKNLAMQELKQANAEWNEHCKQEENN